MVGDDRYLRVLAGLGRQIARVMHREELCRSIVRILREELGYEQVGVWLFNERRGALLLEASEGFGPGFERRLIPVDRGLNGWAFRHGAPRLAADVRRDPEYWGGPSDCASQLVIPLIAHGETLGTLDLESATTDSLTEADQSLLSAVAPAMAAAIEVSTLHERLRDAALTDGLTGLANFRGFSHALAQEVARAKRYTHTFCVAMIDVDGLKAINDARGHLAGDAALRELATDLRVMLRGTDVLARYGGDEFAVLLTQTTRQQAAATMRRVKEWSNIALSYGVAEFPSDGVDSPALLAAADRELYRAKRQA